MPLPVRPDKVADMATMMREHVSEVECPEREDPLLAARLAVPGTPRFYVDRPRLTTCLERGSALPITLVSAPAGSGKTSAAAAWVSWRKAHTSHAETVGWVTFKTGDEQPSIFWPLVVACLRRCGVPLPPELPAGPGDSRRWMLGVLGAALAELPHPVTLVLDGYEIADVDLADGLEFLLGHSGSLLRLVILTRADPVLPLQRFRLSEAVAEVRMAGLAFDEHETTELLSHVGIVLGAGAVSALVERTRGWVAGLRFACMVLDRCAEPDVAVTRLAGDTGDIAEYLTDEILRNQRDDVRDVLLRTSVVEVLQPGLTEELGGRFAARTLASLARANAMVEEIPETPGWYRYHPLFRELLRAELAYSSPSRLAVLQRRAARWYDGQDIVAEPPADTCPTATGTVVPGGEPPTRAEVVPTPALRVVIDQPAPHSAPHSAQSAPRSAPRGPWTEPSLGYIIEPLTPKEGEVLGHLAELLSTEEIAATMFVSVNTVRTHVRNILRKLAVTRRNEAVRRARKLSLLDA
jgi:ATP/maltotriose-dependent transcriptional regulator MalT